MDKARARALLDEERRRLDELSRAVSRDHDDAVAASSPEDPADGADRRLAEETTEALGERLRDRWDALERAEARLAAGTYGASVLSGRPIPDERLEAFPLAELTVDEAAERDRVQAAVLVVWLPGGEEQVAVKAEEVPSLASELVEVGQPGVGLLPGELATSDGEVGHDLPVGDAVGVGIDVDADLVAGRAHHRDARPADQL